MLTDANKAHNVIRVHSYVNRPVPLLRDILVHQRIQG